MLKRLPVTPAIIYLAVGLLVGPTVLNVFHFNPLKESALLEVLTEVAVLISLFSAGVKMPVPVSFARWRTPILLATLSMAVSVGLVAAFAYYLLGLPLGAGVLLGAILAPTDPVLATDVQIRHPGDRDQLRFTLTCEAGMNDGSAFPFVMLGMGLLGLHELGDFGLRWALVDVLWATLAGIAIGVCLAPHWAIWDGNPTAIAIQREQFAQFPQQYLRVTKLNRCSRWQSRFSACLAALQYSVFEQS